MAAVEVLSTREWAYPGPETTLRLVAGGSSATPLRYGAPLAQRRAARVRRSRRRVHSLCLLGLVCAFTVLALPGHTFGATTSAGLSSDLANATVLSSGMDYVVQPGDTVASIARDMNPVEPSLARVMLVHELGSSVVVPGEHVVIP